mmetsp:Transcript_43404/g.67979  ORF Transcript_43404/g.67979 Transcript_43404/m.67979 type:complete len:135 (-) Transcript_43404:303-707(-)
MLLWLISQPNKTGGIRRKKLCLDSLLGLSLQRNRLQRLIFNLFGDNLFLVLLAPLTASQISHDSTARSITSSSDLVTSPVNSQIRHRNFGCESSACKIPALKPPKSNTTLVGHCRHLSLHATERTQVNPNYRRK